MRHTAQDDLYSPEDLWHSKVGEEAGGILETAKGGIA